MVSYLTSACDVVGICTRGVGRSRFGRRGGGDTLLTVPCTLEVTGMCERTRRLLLTGAHFFFCETNLPFFVLPGQGAYSLGLVVLYPARMTPSIHFWPLTPSDPFILYRDSPTHPAPLRTQAPFRNICQHPWEQEQEYQHRQQ